MPLVCLSRAFRVGRAVFLTLTATALPSARRMLTRNKEIERRSKDGRDFGHLLPPAALIERELRQRAEETRREAAQREAAAAAQRPGVRLELSAHSEVGSLPGIARMQVDVGDGGGSLHAAGAMHKVRSPGRLERDRREEAAIKARSLHHASEIQAGHHAAHHAAEASLERALPRPSSLPPPTAQHATAHAPPASCVAWARSTWPSPLKWRH